MSRFENMIPAMISRSKILWLGCVLSCFAMLALFLMKLPAQEPKAPEAVETVVPDDPKGQPRKLYDTRLKSLVKSGRLSSHEASYWLPLETK